MDTNTTKLISLTGDRPTGHLHLGHLAGSLISRIQVQNTHIQRIMIADFQALTHNHDKVQIIKKNILNLMEDYLAVGLDPSKNLFFIQSAIPALHEIGAYYSNLVTVSRLSRNPTLKQEIKDKNMQNSVPVSFFFHPISQAADITAFNADIVPVGEDQKPLIEQTNEIVRKFNSIYGSGIIKEANPYISHTPRLRGIDGLAKASKSMNNAIFLNDPTDVVKTKVFSMYTDPNHIKASDPGQVKGHVVFEYLDAFYPDKNHLTDLKKQYTEGGLGDVYLKSLLFKVLEDLLEPMRARRQNIHKDQMIEILDRGNRMANQIANETLYKIRRAIGI